MNAAQLGAAKQRDRYDVAWLNKFAEAQAIIARVAPARLDEFRHAFDVMRPPPGYSRPRFVPALFSAPDLDGIRATVQRIPKDQLELHEIARFGRFVVHNWPEFTALQQTLTERVSELAGEAVEPSYNFLSLYTRMGVCEPHLDSPPAKWTLDVCVDQSEPWPIYFSQLVPWPESFEERRSLTVETIKADPALQFRAEVLAPGDAVLFTGTNQWHFRDALPPGPGKRFCELLFFHYIPRGTRELVDPSAWHRYFGIPELAEIANSHGPGNDLGG